MEVFVDDKFNVLIEELERRGGWKRCPFQSGRARLVFTNLSRVDWKKVTSKQIVNHFQGSQHLSNKSILAFHMARHGKSSYMPVQWSAAYQDLSELVAMALSCSLLGVVHDQLSNYEKKYSSSQIRHKIDDTERLIRVLEMDTEMRDSEGVISSKSLMKALSSFSTDKNKEILSNIIDRLGANRGQLGPCVIGSQDVWIVKEVGSSCGKGITLCSGTRELLQRVREMSFKCVVQKYIERPLLLRASRKFDIRQWLLVTSLQPFKVFGFSEFYCRLSKQAYHLGASLDNMSMHLCNHAVQAAEEGAAGEDTMCTQEQLAQYLSGMNPAVSLEEVILPQIKQISLDAVASAAGSLTEVGIGFEWLGLDLMVSETMDVFLIEVNVSPDVSRSTSITTRLVEAAFKGLCDLVLSNEGEGPAEGGGEREGPGWELWSPYSGPGDRLATRTGGVPNPAKLKFLDKDYAAKKLHVYDRAVTALGEPATERLTTTTSCFPAEKDASESDDDEL